MELRRRSVPSAKKARTRKSNSPSQNDQRSYLLPDILSIISDRLGIEDVARASLCCRSWALHLRAGIKQAQIVVCEPPDDKEPRLPAVESLAKHSPTLTDLHLLLTSRSSYAATAAVLGKLSCLQSLEHVTLELDISLSPKKGAWPALFSDSLQLGKVPALIIKGSSMPSVTITLFLQQLVKHRQHLKKLHLDWGRSSCFSQLPAYRPPVWLQTLSYPSTLVSTLNANQLEHLVKLTNLQDLMFDADESVASNDWKQLSKLKALTSLKVNGLVNSSVLSKVAALKKLQKLSLCIELLGPTGGKLAKDFSEVKHIEELRIALYIYSVVHFTSDILHQELQCLADTVCSSLQTLTVTTVPWSKSTGECIAQLTALTSLHLMQVHSSDALVEPLYDLTPLGRLRNMTEFSIELPTALSAKITFGVYPEDLPGARRSSRRLSQQKIPQMRCPNDLSAMWTVWPQLQRLRLSGINDAVANETIWNMQQLSQLTSLRMDFVGGSAFLRSPSMDLDQLPGHLKELSLAGCTVGVQPCVRFGESLTSLSLNRCQLPVNHRGFPEVSQCLERSEALELLLAQLQDLQQLELINIRDLCNQQLGKLTSKLASLRSLSVVDIGNPELNHGALLGLTCLTKLRRLRWHVGDVLDQMPDLTSLAKMKGLVSLHIPVALHTQMERWGGYAVLDALPFCDVHVEAV